MATTESAQSPSGPVPAVKLAEITTQACNGAFKTAQQYDHAQTANWNAAIIDFILQALISETSIGGQQPQFKFAVTSTIIQHTSLSDAANTLEATVGGKRGMHSATGAFWNNEKDGMWSHKHEQDEKGFDVVISVMWISIA